MPRVATSDYNLAEIHPELAAEWQADKNGTVTPRDVTPGSAKCVWWVCSEGHAYQARIYSRKAGKGCPYCSGRKAGLDNSLFERHPEITREWHPSKNGKLTPRDVTRGSGVLAWWQCNKGHEYQARIYSRTQGSGCSYCSGRKAGSDNSLSKRHPQIAKQWHSKKNDGLTPSDLTAGSNRKVWWICPVGHEYQAVVYSRVAGKGCPMCSGRLPSPENNLASKFPRLAKEWHRDRNIISPLDVTYGSRKKVWWKCKIGHEWRASIASRSSGHNCPACYRNNQGKLRRQLHVKKKGGLIDNKSTIISEWNFSRNKNISPNDFTTGSDKVVWWRCKHGHEWRASIKSRTRGRGCPKCAPHTSKFEIRIYTELLYVFGDIEWGKRQGKDVCDIFLNDFQLAIEVDGYPWHSGFEERDCRKTIRLREKGINVVRLRDDRLTRISRMDVFYKNDENEFTSVVRLLKFLSENLQLSDATQKRIRTYVSGGRLKNEKEYRKIVSYLPGPLLAKSIEQMYPHLKKEWNFNKNNPLLPRMFSHGSHKKVWWICPKGHEYQGIVAERARGRGCPYCAGKKVVPKESFGDIFPQIASEWNRSKNGALSPDGFRSYSNKKVWWLCKSGHEWKAQISSRARGAGCPYCSGKKVL